MNGGRPFTADELPVTVIDLMPRTLMKFIGTVAVKFTIDVTDVPAFATVALTLVTVKPVLPAISALKILTASVSPPATVPSDGMEAAVARAVDDFAIEPMLAASPAARSRVRTLFATL